jgi:hypothetical protein
MMRNSLSWKRVQYLRIAEQYVAVAVLTGLAIGTFAGACVVAWGRR